MDHEEVLDQLSVRLQEDGLAPGASVEEQRRHLWQQLLAKEVELQSAAQELQTLRTQQASDMKEVESYVAHIRGLLEERECLTSDYERDNELLRQELHLMRQQQESQSKELAEMLAQEELGEMGLSSPSEQVAYLLVERATLLERLEAAERTLEGQRDQKHFHRSMGDELRQQREDMTKAHSEQISERQRLERDLDEASQRLAMAHQDIRRLSSELDAAKSCSQDASDIHGFISSLQRAKEQNERLDAESRALRERVLSLESEKDNLLDQLAQSDQDVTKEEGKEERWSSKPQTSRPDSAQEEDSIHRRCHEAMEDGLVQVRELQRQLQRLRKQQEELEERNEELEALLGEAQNGSKAERHRHEGELEGLHRRIRSLEAELKKQDVHEKMLMNGEDVKPSESYTQMHLRDGREERLALLEARLTEEKDWRKQLEVDLSTAQAALKKDKEALQIGERELKKLRLEVNSLQTECQQGKTLIKSLTQVKGEKAVLEEKVAQMERAHSRLQSELDRYKVQNQNQEDQRETRFQVDQLQEQADRLLAELSSLQTAHSTLRDEAAELQALLSSSIQEKQRLELETERLKEQLRSTKEAPTSSQRPGGPPELDELQLEVEQQLASQHQLALQAQLNEAQARSKSLDSVLMQKAEEAKQMKQDLQRAQSLFSSAERELRYEKEKSLDLKRHNSLLDQEKVKLCAELKQLQTRLGQAEQSVHSLTAEAEGQQQKVRELELELARSTAARSATTSLQEELQAERTRLLAADKKVLELQQHLKSVQHQLRVEAARAGESGRLERDSRDLSDALSALRAQQQEELITRKLLEQREEELQQQLRSLRLKEASTSRTNAELSHRGQQLDTRLAVLEAELSQAREEMRDSQTSVHRLQEDLMSSQQDGDRLQGELQQVLLQLDSHVRKYNQKQTQHKTRLRQAKHVFLKEMDQRDGTIQDLQNQLLLTSSLLLKEKERILTVTEENEKLLEEKRELLRKMSEAEEVGSRGMRTASTAQHRVDVLEVENRQLQDRTLKLSNQVSCLERALRKSQTFCSLESARKGLPPDSLRDGVLHASTLSLTSGSCDPLDILDAICRVKVSDHVVDVARASVSSLQPPEQGYLNLSCPLQPADTRAGLPEPVLSPAACRHQSRAEQL